MEDLRDAEPPRGFPELRRGKDGHQHLLAADRVHLFPDDLLDFPVDSPPDRHERPQAGGDLADEPAAYEQLVGRRLGVGRSVAQGRQKEL
jgi:hypothetical protein